MTADPPRHTICMVGHEATRTGAPAVMLTLARWLNDRGWKVRIILLADGPRVDDFAEIDPDLVVYSQHIREWPKQILNRLAERRLGHWLKRLAWPVAHRLTLRLEREVKAMRPDLVYVNAVQSLRGTANGWRIPTILHVHELDNGIRWSLPPDGQDRLRTVPTHWIAASSAVSEALVERHAIPPAAVTIIPEFLGPVGPPAHRSVMTGPTVLACGTVQWRKGADLFLQAAIQHFTRSPESTVSWVWLGGGWDLEAERLFVEDIAKAGLTGRVELLDAVADPQPYFEQASVFVMSSREDPFPLVCLEALRAGTPVVCFEAAGGMPELIGRAGGRVVPYADCVALTDAIEELLADPIEAKRVAAEGAEIVATEMDVEVAGPRIEALLTAALTKTP